jgi:cation diffusion facilitator family transporter
MNNLLLRLFVKDYQNTQDPKVRGRYAALGSLAGTLCNLLLFALKLAAGSFSGSVSIIADAFNNLSDVGSCGISLLGVQLSERPADEKHPFGHGRLEYISALAIALMILVVGVELLKSSAKKIFSPEPIEFSWLAAGILLLSIGAKLWLGRLNTLLGQKIDSEPMKAAAIDSLSDCAATAATLLALVLAPRTSFPVDGVAGVLVSLLVLRAGYGVAKDTLDALLGQRADSDTVQKISDLLLEYPQIIGLHDLIIHNYGPGKSMATVHAEVPADRDIMALHDAIDRAEREVGAKFNIPLTIHMDPVDTKDEEIAEVRRAVEEKLRELDESLSVHDFRMVSSSAHTNLVFDVLLPSGARITARELISRINEKVKELDESYVAVVTVERPFS